MEKMVVERVWVQWFWRGGLGDWVQLWWDRMTNKHAIALRRVGIVIRVHLMGTCGGDKTRLSQSIRCLDLHAM